MNSNIELWNGETGWPTTGMLFLIPLRLLNSTLFRSLICSTGGSDYGAAKTSTANAKTFFDQGVCGMLDWGVNVFYFEAFDEPWKPASLGLNGQPADDTHWGAMTVDRQQKFPLTC